MEPFLIKKLLKSVICGTVNSAWMHCSQLTKSTIAAEQKKKKKNEKATPMTGMRPTNSVKNIE